MTPCNSYAISYSQSLPGFHDDSTTTFQYRVDPALKYEIDRENIAREGGLMDQVIFADDVETFSTYKKEKVELSFFLLWQMTRTQPSKLSEPRAYLACQPDSEF